MGKINDSLEILAVLDFKGNASIKKNKKNNFLNLCST